MVLLHNLAIRPIPKIGVLFQIDDCEHQDTLAGGHFVFADLNLRIATARF